jgi:hypothetical protein
MQVNELQTTKVFNAIPPAAIKDNGAFVSNVIDKADLQGADYLEFIAALGVTDVAMTTLKVMESDAKSSATALGGTPVLVVDSTIKPADTDDGKVAVFGIDLRKSRLRYLQLQATAGDGSSGTYLGAIAIARRSLEASSAAADRNLLFVEYA